MSDAAFAQWQAGLLILRDEALLPAEAQRRDRFNQWKRDRYRAVAGLHSLKCTGPTRATGCSCVKIPLYGEPG